MPGPLTELEIAQIVDHLGYDNAQFATNYVEAWIKPTLEALTNEASLTIVRGHLETLNTVQAKIKSLVSKAELSEVKGIKFYLGAEARLWATYNAYVAKLGAATRLTPNQAMYGCSANQVIL